MSEKEQTGRLIVTLRLEGISMEPFNVAITADGIEVDTAKSIAGEIYRAFQEWA